MKKTISLVLVLAFILALATNLSVLAEGTATSSDATSTLITTNSGTSTTPELISEPVKEIASSSTPETKLATTSLEKILSPASINLFERIKKIGNDLFGVRKASSTIIKIEEKKATTTNLVDKKIEELKKAGLEKITSLEQVKLFDKITKIGNDLFGVKKLVTKVLPVMSAELITCTSAAIDAKDVSINISLTNSTTDITTAIDTRGVCQKAALTATTERQGALNACNKAFQTSVKSANDKAKTAQKEIWTNYKTSLKACATSANTTEINIEDGGDILK